MTLLELFVTISLHEMKQDNLNERDGCGVPFSEQQYIHMSYFISLIPRMASNFRHLLSCGTIGASFITGRRQFYFFFRKCGLYWRAAFKRGNM